MRLSDTLKMLRERDIFRPFNLALLAFLLFLVLFSSAYFELKSTKDEIFHVMKEEASTLITALELGGANSLVSYSEIESLEQDLLLQIAEKLRTELASRRITYSELKILRQKADLSQIAVLDEKGHPVLFEGKNDSILTNPISLKVLEPVLDGRQESLMLGFEQKLSDDDVFGVALHLSGGGALVVILNPTHLLDLRKRLGIGRLLGELSKTPGIEYIVLQDSLGILAASKNIQEISSIPGDPFLSRALANNAYDTRFTHFGNLDVYEVVQPFKIQGQILGLFRIGLKTDHILAANRRLKRRFLLLSLAMLFIGIVLMSFLVVSQNLSLLNRSYREIQTYTGNILENMADAVMVVNAEGKITLWNRKAEKLFGPKENEMLGRFFRDIQIDCLEAFGDFLQSGDEQWDKEIDCVIAQKKKRLSARFSKVEATEEASALWVALFRDVTRQRAIERRLQRQDKLSAMGELAAGVAHEIRNPLNAISMIFQRIAREFIPQKGREEYAHLTKMAISEIRRVNQIIQQFLEFARPPRLHLEKKHIDDLLLETLGILQEQAEIQGVRVEVQLDSGAEIFLDPNQLKQAFLNLFRNALEAMPDGGVLRLYSRSGDDSVQIEITDTGKGIPPDQLPKIFNLYFTTKADGTGLGLSLVHQIISAHGGSIHVQSEVQKGTTFRIVLPLEETSCQKEVF